MKLYDGMSGRFFKKKTSYFSVSFVSFKALTLCSTFFAFYHAVQKIEFVKAIKFDFSFFSFGILKPSLKINRIARLRKLFTA